MGSTGQATPEEDVWEVWWCYDGWHPPRKKLQAVLPPWAKLHCMDPALPLAQQVANARVLIPTTGLVDAAVIAAAPHLKLIAQPAAGTANIDLEAAKQRGIPVTYAPGCNDAATAEVALLLILMLMRRVDEARQAFHDRLVGEPVGHDLPGKVLGLVGCGRVGRCLAASAAALGMTVLSTNSSSSREELESLLRQSDVVSLHCQLNASTHGLIGAAELALMKPSAVLVNTSRGHVLDRDALLEALRAGHLAGVGLDVGWDEPDDPADELYRHPKVLALPHCGSATDEVYARMAHVLCHNIQAIREGGELLHRLC